MTDQLRFRILGCGSSGGVPRLGGNWGACDPNNPKNENGRTQVLIDTSPDMRAQLLQAQVGRLDAVLYTHDHADHVHGLDDLRMIVFNRRSRLPVWANQVTSAGLLSRFSYAFKQPEGSAYPPILQLNHIEGPVKLRMGKSLHWGSGSVPWLTYPMFQPCPLLHGRLWLALTAGYWTRCAVIRTPHIPIWPKALSGLINQTLRAPF